MPRRRAGCGGHALGAAGQWTRDLVGSACTRSHAASVAANGTSGMVPGPCALVGRGRALAMDVVRGQRAGHGVPQVAVVRRSALATRLGHGHRMLHSSSPSTRARALGKVDCNERGGDWTRTGSINPHGSCGRVSGVRASAGALGALPLDNVMDQQPRRFVTGRATSTDGQDVGSGRGGGEDQPHGTADTSGARGLSSLGISVPDHRPPGGGDTATRRLPSANELRRLFGLAHGESRNIAVAVSLLFLSSGVTLSVPMGMGKIIDIIVGNAGGDPSALTSTLM